jgi:hypothetical protein
MTYQIPVIKELDQLRSALAASQAENARLREALESIPGKLDELAKHHVTAEGNLTDVQKMWSHDTLLTASSVARLIWIKDALKGTP